MSLHSSLMLVMRALVPDSGIDQDARRSLMPMALASAVVRAGLMTVSSMAMRRPESLPKSMFCICRAAALRSGPLPFLDFTILTVSPSEVSKRASLALPLALSPSCSTRKASTFSWFT